VDDHLALVTAPMDGCVRCSWETWYSAIGHALGNSFRIGPDDTNWPGVLTDIDTMAALWANAGPGGWNDPCLLLGADSKGNEDVTELQSRAQFSMWAVLAAPMLLSQSVVNMSANRLETYTNTEVIGVGQDIMGRQGQRLVGGPLSGGGDGNVPLTMQPCIAGAPAQTWAFDVPAPGFLAAGNGSLSMCANVDDCGSALISFDCVTTGGTCCGPACYNNEIFSLNAADGTLRSAMAANMCVTSSGLGQQAVIAPCTGASNQKLAYDAATGAISNAGSCLTSGGSPASTNRTNVWGRPLSDGSWALVFINAGSAPVDIACSYAECLSQLGWEPEVNATVCRGFCGDLALAHRRVCVYARKPAFTPRPPLYCTFRSATSGRTRTSAHSISLRASSPLQSLLKVGSSWSRSRLTLSLASRPRARLPRQPQSSLATSNAPRAHLPVCV
jgi:hypothetical protein